MINHGWTVFYGHAGVDDVGHLRLILRYSVERKHQQYATDEAEEALAANI